MEIIKYFAKEILFLAFFLTIFCLKSVAEDFLSEFLYQFFGITKEQIMPTLKLITPIILYIIFGIYMFHLGHKSHKFIKPVPALKKFLELKIKQAHKYCKSGNTDLDILKNWHKNVSLALEISFIDKSISSNFYHTSITFVNTKTPTKENIEKSYIACAEYLELKKDTVTARKLLKDFSPIDLDDYKVDKRR